jgi:hypothetical protein
MLSQMSDLKATDKEDSRSESDECCNCFEEITVLVDLAHELADRMKKLEELLEMHKVSKLLSQIPI